jgi:hypothetical protein
MKELLGTLTYFITVGLISSCAWSDKLMIIQLRHDGSRLILVNCSGKIQAKYKINNINMKKKIL